MGLGVLGLRAFSLDDERGTRVFFCCSVSFVVGSLKDEPGRRVSE